MGAWSHYLRHLGDMTLFDLLWSLSEALPKGMYDPLGLATFVRQGFAALGLEDSFASLPAGQTGLPRELYIIATDLDNGQRAVFGPGCLDAPISTAVAASSAMPMLYKPVKVGDGEYIDGGARGNASIDLAIEQGASLVVCINPLVPFDNQGRDKIPFLGPDGGHLSEKGVQSIFNQVFRIMLHSGLHYHIKQVRRAHPEVDVILIEPKPEDYQMFFYNIMRYSARLIVAQHGFESVTYDLAVDYPMYKAILERHGVAISRRFVIEELNEIANSDNDPTVIRRVLERRSPGCGPRRRGSPLCQLEETLKVLEQALDQMS
jgi:predicted acylesterase/phospholipase RssA